MVKTINWLTKACLTYRLPRIIGRYLFITDISVSEYMFNICFSYKSFNAEKYAF